MEAAELTGAGGGPFTSGRLLYPPGERGGLFSGIAFQYGELLTRLESMV